MINDGELKGYYAVPPATMKDLMEAGTYWKLEYEKCKGAK